MPAKKPQGLNKRHDTAEEKAARIGDEQALNPKRELPLNPPAQLKGHKVAGSIWRRMIRVYGELEAKIVNAMDLDILVDLCMTAEELTELSEMREKSKTMESIFRETFDLARQSGEVKDIVAAAKLISAEKDRILKIDARVDQKKKLLHTLRQSLYLTPRSRTATSPDKKTPEAPADPFENLLDEAIDFTKTGGKGDAR